LAYSTLLDEPLGLFEEINEKNEKNNKIKVRKKE